MIDLATTEREAELLADWDARLGYLRFLAHVTVNAQPDKLPFRTIAEEWQIDRERRRAGAIDNLAGIKKAYAGKRRFYSGCAKGNDKSTGVGRRLLFLLAYSRTPLQLYICSGKEEQAAIVTAAMKMELDCNPWLADKVSISDFTGTGASGSELTVMPMRAATGQGIFPDYLVADEVSHWEHDEGRKFWNFIVSSIRKRPNCVVEVLTNAGHIGSWQWQIRNEIKAEIEYWDFFEQEPYSKLASWMDDAAIERDGKLMDPGEKKRLLYNVWIDPGEERGYLTLAEAEACVDEQLWEITRGSRDQEYYIAVDYGGVNDRTALGILHPVKGTDGVVIDRLECWQGSHKDPIKISRPSEDERLEGLDFRSVEEWIDISLKNFPTTSTLVFDPYQMESLAQKYERKGYRVVRFEYRGGKTNYQMAQLLKNYVQNRKISWSKWAGVLEAPGIEDVTFAQELARLVKKPMSYGYRFDHEAGRHDDRATCVGSCLVVMVPEMPPAEGGPKTEKAKDGEITVKGMPFAMRQDWASARGMFGMGKH